MHVTTVATTSTVAEVVGGARDDLLLGKLNELAGLDEVGTTEGLAGGESPAGTALTLVLDGGDSTFGNPVDGVSDTAGGRS